jgi:predicted amidophosphoribosyltransferase
MGPLVLFWLLCGIAASFIASSRGANGCLWAFLSFLLGPIGLLMAFASQSAWRCPYCQSGVHKDATVCQRCGREIDWDADDDTFCTACGNVLTEGAAFCGKCGKPVVSTAPKTVD